MDEDQLLKVAYSNYRPSDIEEAKKDVQKQIFDLMNKKQYEHSSDNISSYYGTEN